MARKAVHLELVSGYSSEDFIAVFRRFISTREQYSGLHSDQGTTFVGAKNLLRQMYAKACGIFDWWGYFLVI